MSTKKRSKEEVEEMLRAFSSGMSILDISQRFKISESAFYRILKVSRGEPAEPGARQRLLAIEKLKKTLQERDREIALLRAALKKS